MNGWNGPGQRWLAVDWGKAMTKQPGTAIVPGFRQRVQDRRLWVVLTRASSGRGVYAKGGTSREESCGLLRNPNKRWRGQSIR